MIVYTIFDTSKQEYVIKRQRGYGGAGTGQKRTWEKPSAAKNAAMIIIKDDWYADGKSYECPERFVDQSRYEIHEMSLEFVKKV